MKRILALCLLASAVAANAQEYAGTVSVVPRVGVALSNLGGDGIVFNAGERGESATESKYREGFVAGADVQYQAHDNFAVSAGLFYSRQGCRYDDTSLRDAGEGTHTTWKNLRTNLDYLSVPLMGHFYFARGLSLNFGVRPAFLLHNSVHTEETTVTIGKDGSYTYEEPARVSDAEYSFYRKFDLSIPVGLSYEFMNVVIDARYNIGCIGLGKDPDATGTNRSFWITAGYKLNL